MAQQQHGKGEDYGFDETMKRTGIYIMGAKTYKEMLKSGMAGGKERTYVITGVPLFGKFSKLKN